MFGRLHNWMNKKSDQIFHTFVWLLTGMVITWAGTAMLLSGSVNMDCFYDVGEVYDVFEAQIKSPGWQVDYDSYDEAYRVVADAASKDFTLSGKEKEWVYVCVKLSKLSDENGRWIFECRTASDEWVRTAPYTMKDGENIIPLPKDVKINLVRMVFEKQNWLSFKVEKVQLRENMPVFSWKKAGIDGGIVFGIYILLTIFVVLLKRLTGKQFGGWDWYVGIKGLQHIYMKCGNVVSMPFAMWNNMTRSKVRRGLFAFMILCMQILFVQGKYESNRYFKYDILLCIIVLILIALISVERPLRLVNWKNRLVGAWMALWLMAVISDIYVAKRYANIGYVMILVVGLFFFCWNNMRQPKKMIEDFVGAVEISFVLNAGFCFLFRPYTSGYRYLGAFYNPGIFAIYLLFVVIALLAKLVELMPDKEKRGTKVRLIMELAVAVNFLWKTQSTTELMAIVLVVILFLVVALRHMYETASVTKNMLGGLAGCILFLCIYVLSGIGISNIPQFVGHEVKFEKDIYEISEMKHPLVVEVNAATTESNRILQKLKSSSLEELTTGRSLYWVAYSRKLNLLGHENKENLWGANRWPHNGFVAIAYRYGIFAVIPYIIMVICMVVYSGRILYEKKAWGFYLCAISIAGIVLILLENMELPFAWLSWFSFYLMMGYLFEEKSNREDVAKD